MEQHHFGIIMRYQEISLDHVSYSGDRQAQLELHSFLNLLNVINMQLSVTSMELDADDELQWIMERTLELAEKVKKGDTAVLYPNHIEQYCTSVLSELEKLKIQFRNPDFAKVVEDSAGLMQEFFGVLKVRSSELLAKILSPGKWEAHDLESYKEEFLSFFSAVEKNSRGRYRIIYNIARQEELDYLVQLDIESEFGHAIYMPLSFKDVIRDLVANARKYTSPGGQIDIGIYQDRSMLRFSVKDSGMGIPAEEMERVFEFGYRASNVVGKPTMGGGFGLTKAAYVTKQLGGRIFLASEEGVGTRIRIEIPIPKQVIHQIETNV